MKRSLMRTQRKNAGFTLIEALVAVALMGLILGALGAVTAQWLPNWNRGLIHIQRNEQVAVALDRLVADLAEAQYVLGGRTENKLLFEGNEIAVTFVRPAIGPNTDPGLEIVRIAETADGRGSALVRTRAPFVPLPTGNLSVDPIPFADPVVLLRASFRVTFSYGGPDGRWFDTWNSNNLPKTVRFLVRNVADERAPVMATATRVRVDARAPEPPTVEETQPAGSSGPPAATAGLR